MIHQLIDLWLRGWRSLVEVLLLWVAIYYGYLYFRGTRGAKVLTGLAIVFLTLTLISTLLNLVVIGWIVRSFSVFLAIALVVIFQPELRRGLAALGGHPIFSLTSERRETVHDLAEAVTQLANKQFGALIAIERDTSIRVYEETGVIIDGEFSVELILTIFHPKAALHDGGVIIRNGRVAAAACIFPVSQRETLDRSLGLRHRAGLGFTEESDAIAIVISEETGAISIDRKSTRLNSSHLGISYAVSCILTTSSHLRSLHYALPICFARRRCHHPEWPGCSGRMHFPRQPAGNARSQSRFATSRRFGIYRGIRCHCYCDLGRDRRNFDRSEEHTSELQSLRNLVCRLLHSDHVLSPPLPTLRSSDLLCTTAVSSSGMAGLQRPHAFSPSASGKRSIAVSVCDIAPVWDLPRNPMPLLL